MECAWQNTSPLVRAELAYREAARLQGKGRMQRAQALYTHAANLFHTASTVCHSHNHRLLLFVRLISSSSSHTDCRRGRRSKPL